MGKFHRVVVVLLLLLYSKNGGPSGVDDANKLSQVTQKITAALGNFGAGGNKFVAVVSDEWNDLKMAETLETVKKLKKYIGGFSKTFNVLSGVAQIWDVVAMFLPKEESAELKFMRQNFDAVNSKIDELFKEETKTREYINFVAIRNRLADADASVKTVSRELETTLVNINAAHKKKQKAKILGNLLTQIETTNLAQKLTVLVESFTSQREEQNIFLSTEKVTSNDWLQIVSFAAYYVGVYERGSILLSVYYKYRGIGEVGRLAGDKHQMQDGIFTSFTRCTSNIDNTAQAHIETILNKYSKAANRNVVNAIKAKLDESLSWYIWSVVAYDVLEDDEEDAKHIVDNVADRYVAHDQRGIIPFKRKKDIDGKTRYRWVFAIKNPTAQKIDQAIENIFCGQWRRSKSIDSILLATSIIAVGDLDDDEVSDFQSVGPGMTLDDCGYKNKKGHFTASVTPWSDPCRAYPCKNAGNCRSVPLSPHWFCQCVFGYGGETCEVDMIAETTKQIKLLMDSIGDVMVPTVIDVYYDLMEKSDEILTSIDDVKNLVKDAEKNLLKNQNAGFTKLQEGIKSISEKMGSQYEDVKRTIDKEMEETRLFVKKNIDDSREKITSILIDLNKNQKATTISQAEITRSMLKTSTFLVRKDIKSSLDRVLLEIKQNQIKNQHLGLQQMRAVVAQLKKNQEYTLFYSTYSHVLGEMDYFIAKYESVSTTKLISERRFYNVMKQHTETSITFDKLFYDMERMMYRAGKLSPQTDYVKIMMIQAKSNMDAHTSQQWNQNAYYEYVKHVATLRNSLLTALRIISQSELLYRELQGKINKGNTVLLNSIKKIVTRQASMSLKFVRHLAASSCPVVHAENMVNPLQTGYSFEGMEWKVQCEQGYIGYPDILRCVKDLPTGKLVWDGIPICYKSIQNAAIECRTKLPRPCPPPKPPSHIPTQLRNSFSYRMILAAVEAKKGKKENADCGGENQYRSVCELSCGLNEQGGLKLLEGQMERSTECSSMPCVSFLKGTTCRPCPLGYFTFGSEVRCINCEGSRKCRKCSTGTFSNIEGAKSCTECPPGWYSDVAASTKCNKCPAGSYSQMSGSPSCSACSAGTYSHPESNKCNICGLGTYSHQSAAACKNCPSGTFAASTGSSSCTPCRPGEYSKSGANSCEDCHAGTYSKANSGSCTRCRAGYHSPTRSSRCVPCAPGTYAAPDASKCLNCRKGTYSGAGSTRCTDCSPGTYNDGVGKMSCIKCKAGYFSNRRASTCTACLEGTYNSKSGSRYCHLCGYGTYSASTGSTSCTECPAGSFGPTREASRCKLCEPGEYQGGRGKSICHNCPTGKVSDHQGATSCSGCPAGMYYEYGDHTTCHECPANTYNRYAGTSGKSSCSKCGSGHYSSAGASKCDPCPRGEYRSYGSSYGCQKCPSGTFNSRTGKAFCRGCDRGEYSFYSGSTSCISCPAGQYQDGFSRKNCKDCPSGYTSPSRSSRCFKRQEDYIMQTNHWGRDSNARWTYWQMCPAGTWPDSVNVQIDKEWGDNKGLTRISLGCWDTSSSRRSYITSGYVDFGRWGKREICSGYIIGYTLQSCNEEVGAVDLKVRCDDGRRLWPHWWGGSSGPCKWSSWKQCKDGFRVCGIRTKLESDQGVFHDNSAINDVDLKCCPIDRFLYHPGDRP